jgi:uncharacterized protein
MRAVKKTENRFLRAVLRVLGILFVGLGILGIIFPIFPATPNFLLATWCFMKSSDRLYHWLMTNRVFGKYLKNYLDKKGIPVFIKVFILTFLWLMIGYAVLFIFTNIYINIALLVVAAGITIHILMIKTYKEDPNEIH